MLYIFYIIYTMRMIQDWSAAISTPKQRRQNEHQNSSIQHKWSSKTGPNRAVILQFDVHLFLQRTTAIGLNKSRNSIIIRFCKQQLWLTNLNHGIYFTQSQLQLAKTDEDRTASQKALYFLMCSPICFSLVYLSIKLGIIQIFLS